MINCACPPAASSAKVSCGHFRTPIAAYLRMQRTQRQRTSKYKSQGHRSIFGRFVCSEEVNRTLFPYLEGETARRKCLAKTS